MPDAANTIDLPGILAEIADAAGTEAALLVAQAVGGRRAYFPGEPGPDHWLSRLIGQERARAVCAQLTPGDRGIELEVPLGPCGSRARRWRRIHEMLEDGASKPAIAAATGVHHKTVQRHKSRRGKTSDRGQGELF